MGDLGPVGSEAPGRAHPCRLVTKVDRPWAGEGKLSARKVLPEPEQQGELGSAGYRRRTVGGQPL